MTDEYTMEMRLCDDEGMVSHEHVEEEGSIPLAGGLTYLKRHISLQQRTEGGRAFLKKHPDVMEKPWPCTGHAHLAGEHIRCTSPAHRKVKAPTTNEGFVGALVFPSPTVEGIGFEGATNTTYAAFPAVRPDPKVSRCANCYAELFEADNGYGGVRLACPTHGFERSPIIEVPRWVEDWVREHPIAAIGYVAYIADSRARCESCGVLVWEDAPTYGEDAVHLCLPCLGKLESEES